MKFASFVCILFAGIAASAIGADSPPADSFTIRADWFDRGNVRADKPGKGYAGKYPCIWNAGELPNQSEYDIDFPVTADYTFVALYTAATPRPVDIYLDGKKVHGGFAGVTGNWKTDHARWEKQCTMHVTEGKHTIKLLCPGSCMPHICGFRMESPVPFPKGWKLSRKIARLQAEPDLTKDFVKDYPREPPPVYDYHQPFKMFAPPTPRAHRLLEYTLFGGGKYKLVAQVVKPGDAADTGPAANNELLDKREAAELETTQWVARLSVKVNEKRTETDTLNLFPKHLKKMLSHAVRLIDDFRGGDFRGGDFHGIDEAKADFLQAERAEALKLTADAEALLAQPDSVAKWERFYQLYLSAYKLKNRVALSNPLIDFDKLLLAKRLTYGTSHIYTTYYDGSTRYKEGSGIVVLSPVRPDGQITNLTKQMKTDAIYRDPDLSFDARRVLFSYKADHPSPCHIHEIGIDGAGLRRLTDSEYDDVDPCYLPDGKKIMFVSTRCRRVTLCHNAFTVSVLYTMNSDGSGIRCISPNTVHDFKPSVMPNGQVTFTRWEYVDKHLGNVQSLWTGNPDGTRMTHIAGNHFGPLTYWEPFRVPGSRLFVCVLAPHMPLACGPVALVHPADTHASPAIYENITPELPPAVHFGWLRKDVGYYTYAYPLSEKYFIASYCYGPDDRDPVGYGLYMLDRWNNRDLIYRDPDLAAFEPVPVRPRRVPTVVVSRGPEDEEQGKQQTGVFYVANVYEGLEGIERGEVKYLRVVEEIPKPVSANCPGYAIQYPVISNRGHLALKRLWGTVPVEPDGSAHFRVPAGKALYFAALDENFMEIQRMRSFTSVAPGEKFGCVGCHEQKHTAPISLDAAAFHRGPSDIAPPPHGGVHGPDFYNDVQPVLNKHCIKCHGGPKPKGEVDLSPDFTNLFNVAYETLTNKKLVKYVSDYTCESLPTRGPKYYGSYASKVIEVLLTTHKEEDRVNIPPEDFRRLVTWIDCNCPYYGTYTFNQPGTIGGRELFFHHRKELNEIYGRRCQSCHGPPPSGSSVNPSVLYRIRLPEVEKTRALLAPLGRSAGGDESCSKPIFADRNDPDFKKLTDILAKIKAQAQSNPRADMFDQRPPLLDPKCRYIYRP